MNWPKWLTESDNSTACPVRMGAVATAAMYHAAAGWGIGHGLAIDMASLGAYVQHMSLLLGVTAGGVGAKSLMKADAQ